MSEIERISDDASDAASVHTFDFHGDRVHLVDISGKPHIVLRPAIDALGLSYSRQFRKLESRSWAISERVRATGADGRSRLMVTVDVPTFLMLLSTVDENRVSDRARLKVAIYQREISDAISTVRDGATDYPRRAPLEPEKLRENHSGWAYVVEFSSGVVKVGQTKRLRARIGQHAQAALAQGRAVTRSWTSPRHAHYSLTERALISFCGERWRPAAGSEYFEAADYEEIVRFAESLTQSELDVGGAA